jgi:EAL and modified HD-GYP domain-containing signal transduction protein
MQSVHDIPAIKLNYLHLLSTMHRNDLEIAEIERILRQDVSLSYRLLRYLNSALFGMRTEIRSIRHALCMLGENQIRIWVALIATMQLASDKPAELVAISLFRARFSESIAVALGRTHEKDDLFLMGLLSVVDALLDCPMAEVMEQLPLSQPAKAALSGQDSFYRDVYECVVAYEHAAWVETDGIAARLRLDPSVLAQCYLDSIKWAGELMESFNSSEVRTGSPSLAHA